MTTPVSRRQLLAAAGVGLGLATAGCAGSSGERTVTASLRQTEQVGSELQDDREQLQDQIDAGNISRQEAGQQYSDILSEELIQRATTEAQSRNLIIEDSITIRGPRGTPRVFLLVSGSSDALLAFVETDIVGSLANSDQFNEIQQQQQPQANQTTSSGT